MKRTQRGMTLIGFLISMAVVGVFVFMGMKVIPMYTEYKGVQGALKSIAAEPDIASQPISEIRSRFEKHADTGYIESVKGKDLKIERRGSGYFVTAEYDVRRPLIYNLDVVGRFKAEQELRRGADL